MLNCVYNVFDESLTADMQKACLHCQQQTKYDFLNFFWELKINKKRRHKYTIINAYQC